MQLTVKTLKGIKFVIDIDPTCTIAEVKTVIVSSSSSSSSKTVMIIIIFTIEPFDVYFDIICHFYNNHNHNTQNLSSSYRNFSFYYYYLITSVGNTKV